MIIMSGDEALGWVIQGRACSLCRETISEEAGIVEWHGPDMELHGPCAINLALHLIKDASELQADVFSESYFFPGTPPEKGSRSLLDFRRERRRVGEASSGS